MSSGSVSVSGTSRHSTTIRNRSGSSESSHTHYNIQNVIYLPEVLPADLASYYYKELQDFIEWQDSIPSKKYKGSTRKAHQYDLHSPAKHILAEIEGLIGPSIMTALAEQTTAHTMEVLGCYLNYYVNGEMFTPMHSHPNQNQIIISLGATRTLLIKGKKYSLHNGDVIIFGNQSHGVPKEPEIQDGRISIALFTSMK